MGFAGFLHKFFISEPTAHTVVFFYFMCYLFWQKMWIKGFSTESEKFVWKNLCLKAKFSLHSRKRNYSFFKGRKWWREHQYVPEVHKKLYQWSPEVQTLQRKLRTSVSLAWKACPERHHRSDTLEQRACASVTVSQQNWSPSLQQAGHIFPTQDMDLWITSQKVALKPPWSFLTPQTPGREGSA